MLPQIATFYFLVLLAFGIPTVFADEDLAKASQNPIGNMISLPMQNNTYFNVGPSEEWAGLVLAVTSQTAFPKVKDAKTAPEEIL